MKVSVNGVEIYYEQTGSGRPLIMVHGNGEDHTIFDKAANVLKDSFTCYLVDSRGHGQSSAVDVFHYGDMASDMVGFMEELDLKDVVFYGFSDGGIVGILAAAASDRITALIISGANISPKGVKLKWRLLFRCMYLFKKDPLLELMIREPDVSDEVLRKIRARTLVLAGSRDMIVERETRHIAEVVPRAELRILDGESHGSYIIHNDRIGEIIKDFVEEDGYESLSHTE